MKPSAPCYRFCHLSFSIPNHEWWYGRESPIRGCKCKSTSKIIGSPFRVIVQRRSYCYWHILFDQSVDTSISVTQGIDGCRYDEFDPINEFLRRFLPMKHFDNIFSKLLLTLSDILTVLAVTTVTNGYSNTHGVYR